MICRLLALFGIYIYIFDATEFATDNSRLQPRPRALFPGFGAMEKRPGDEVALASFDRNECWGTEVRDQTEIA